ncbi:MAG: hypothetical protein KGR26_05180, partial [Cyanobacteria bacterium REEB65]|nr:hypothetical protein [Cyanobacteria bacterium REEB65]
EGVAELAPPVLLGQIAAIDFSHEVQADKQIMSLPWDSRGNWQNQAAQIRTQQVAQAGQDVANLPLVSAAGSAGQAVASGASTVATAAQGGASAVGGAVVFAASATKSAAVQSGKSVGRGFLATLAAIGQRLLDFATNHEQAFQ